MQVYATVAQLVWGLWLCLWNDVFSTSPSFRYMADRGTELQWGVTIFCIGLLSCVSIWMVHSWYTRVINYLSLGIWLIIAGMIGASNFKSTGTVTYFFIAVFYAISLVFEEKYQAVILLGGKKYE